MHGKYANKGEGRKKLSDSDKECYNCHKKGHLSEDCWSKGSGKEGQGPKSRQKGKGSQNRTHQAADTINEALNVACMATSGGTSRYHSGGFPMLWETPLRGLPLPVGNGTGTGNPHGSRVQVSAGTGTGYRTQAFTKPVPVHNGYYGFSLVFGTPLKPNFYIQRLNGRATQHEKGGNSAQQGIQKQNLWDQGTSSATSIRLRSGCPPPKKKQGSVPVATRLPHS